MVFSIISIVLWLIYSIIEGRREAYYYELIAKTPLIRPNIHYLYFFQRGTVLILIGLANNSILLPLGLAFIFSIIHDGFYYIKYNDLDENVYKKRFIDSSTTSTAILEFSFMERLVMFIGGLIIIYIYYHLQFK